MEIEQQAAIALKWNAVAKLFSQTFSWAVTLIVLRLLTPDDYGLMAITAVITSIIAGIAEFGLGSSLIQSQNLSRNELSSLAGALALLNVGCGLLVAAAAPFLAMMFNEPKLSAVIAVSSCQFLLYAIEVVPQSLIQREMQFKKNAGIELASIMTSSTATLILAWSGQGVWSLVIGNLAGGVLRTTLLVCIGTTVWPSFRFANITRHLRFGGIMTAARFLWQFAYQADVLVAGKFLTENLVGLYSVSIHFATLPMQKIMSIVNQVAFPAIARLQDELPRLRSRLLDSLRLLTCITVPILWGLSAVSLEFVDVLLGDQWHPAIVPLQIAALVVPMRILMALFATALTAIGRVELELRNMLVSAALLPVAFLLGVRANLNGLAMSWAIVIPIVFAVNFPRTSAALGITLGALARAVRVPLLAGAAMYLAITGVRSLLGAYEELLRLPLLIIVGGATYFVAVQLLDRTMWTDLKRLVAIVRGHAPAPA